MQIKVYKLAKKYKFLIAIVLIASFLRVCSISSNPPSLNWDEISHGYNAYSILQTGEDEWGETLPMIFRAYGDYKLPVYIYTTVLSVAIFGLNTFAVRLPSVFAGVGIVIFTYFLTLEIFGQMKNGSQITKHKTLALLAALLVAIEPWSLFLSRGAFEANLALFFFVGGIYFFLKVLHGHATRYLLLATIFLGLTVWTYNSYRVFTPLMIAVLVFIHKDKFKNFYKKDRSAVHWSLITAALLLLPMFYQMANVSGQARYEKVAIIDEGAINKINEQRNTKNYPQIIEKFLYNRPVFFAKTAFRNWLMHFSPQFLFLEGGSQYQYSVQDHGLVYLINIPFILLGFIFLIREALVKKQRYAIFILSWIILAPIPASITRDSPHALRTITMLPVPMILTSIGMFWIAKRISKMENGEWGMGNLLRLGGALYILLLSISFVNYWSEYFNDYRRSYSWSWQYGYEETVDFVKANYEDYEKIIYTKKYGEPHIFLLFHWPWGPEDYRNDPNLIRFEQSDWFWVDRFDKFYFANDWEVPTRSDQDFVLESGEEFNCDFSKCLLVTSPGTRQPDWKLLETVYFLDGKPAFEIYEN